MVFEFKLPDIGEGVHEGEISKWLVSPGQAVKEDEPMVEVMTDKVTVEITSPVSGVVQELLYKEGDTVKVGSVIIRIYEVSSGEAKRVEQQQDEQLAHTQNGGTSQKMAQANGGGIEQSASVATATRPASPSGKVLAPPAVRKLARSMGIDLALVSGSGPHGRIRKDDVLAFKPGKMTARPQAMMQQAPVERREERIPFIGMRRKIGEHLVKSKHTAPHFTYVEEADMSQIVQLRQDLLPHADLMGVKLSYLPFIIKAVIEGLKKFPKLNSTLDEQTKEIVLKHYYNIGIAVATPEGLIVPVIQNAHTKSILDLAVEIVDLSDKARNNKLSLSDLQDGTFTLTSIGSIGGIFSAPIVNYPEVAIMGIQKIEKRPVVRNDEIVIREMTYFSISCDHRVVDGAEAALFMKEVIDWLEHPGRFLLAAV